MRYCVEIVRYIPVEIIHVICKGNVSYILFIATSILKYVDAIVYFYNAPRFEKIT